MPIIGYGEDGLTYRVVSQHVGELLRRLGDQTHPEQCLIFYRPSFGRAGGTGSSQFGEFDAILRTNSRIYLIESKWDGSLAVLDGAVLLRPEQVFRHQIFRWILERWSLHDEITWGAFRDRYEQEFEETFSGKPLAPVGSRLAENLQYVLNQLRQDPQKREIHDLLLYFTRGAVNPHSVVPANPAFELISWNYATINESNFFEIQ